MKLFPVFENFFYNFYLYLLSKSSSGSPHSYAGWKTAPYYWGVYDLLTIAYSNYSGLASSLYVSTFSTLNGSSSMSLRDYAFLIDSR
jgi:hypothetical protein